MLPEENSFHISQIAKSIATIDTGLGVIYPYNILGLEGYTEIEWFSVVWRVVLTDIDAKILFRFHVENGGTFRFQLIHSTGSDNPDNEGNTASGVIYIHHDADGDAIGWDHNAANFDIVMPVTNALRFSEYGTNVVIANNSDVGVMWFKDDNAEGSTGFLYIFGGLLIKQ